MRPKCDRPRSFAKGAPNLPEAATLGRSVTVAFLFAAGVLTSSCGGNGGSGVPQGGGPGTVLKNTDARETADVPRDAQVDGSKDAASTTDGKRDVPADVAVASSDGGSAGAGGADAQAETGTEARPAMNPCRACELRRCTKPQNDFDTVDVAYDLCFLDIDVPADPPILRQDCGGDQLASRLTTAGTNPGTSKSVLCHAILDCIAKTKCSGALGVDDFQTCYCGAGVSSTQCQAVDFVPKGACADVIAAGAESTSNPAVTMGFNAACLASGAAFYSFGCYENCCSKECLGVDPSPNADDSYCNEPLASSGTAGTGGTGQSVGVGGAGGQAGGGAAGAGGHGQAAGSGGGGGPGGGTGGSVAGGIAGSGGRASGAAGAAGSGAAGSGAGGMSGSGAGGMSGSGAGGMSGSGAPGSGGASPPPGTDQFNGSTTPWTSAFGAAVTYSTSDADGSPTSGSLDLAVTSGDASAVWIVAANRCVSALPAATYDLSAKIFIPVSSTGDLAGVGLWYYASSDCSGAPAATFSAPQEAVVGVWKAVTASAQVPAGTQSMSVRLLLTKPYGKATAEALIDDVLVTKR